MKKLKFILILGLSVGAIFSCSKDQATGEDSTVEAEFVASAAQAEGDSDSDIDFAMDMGGTYGTMGKGAAVPPNVPSCATVTVTNGTAAGGFPKVILVDFGTTGCTGPNGVVRKGKIKYTHSAPMKTPQSITKIERENYYVNNNKVEGTTTYKNITTDPNVPTWLVSHINGKVTKPNGDFVSWNMERKQRLIEGANTPIPSDDIMQIFMGVKNVTKSNGNTLHAEVTAPLIKRFICPFISKGSVTYTGTNVNGVLDYGNGMCDNKATFTKPNGQVINITL